MLIVVGLVIAQDPPQMGLVPDEGAVEELAAPSPDPAFGDRSSGTSRTLQSTVGSAVHRPSGPACFASLMSDGVSAVMAWTTGSRPGRVELTCGGPFRYRAEWSRCRREVKRPHYARVAHLAQLKKCQLAGGGAGDDAVGPGG